MNQTQARQDDERALSACAQGSSSALEELYHRYAGSCLAHARVVLRDPEHAQDAVQEAFLDLWRHSGRYSPGRGSVRSWLLMLTHRKAVDRVRAEQRRRTLLLDETHDRPDPAPPADVQALTAVLGGQAREALGALTEVKREAVVLAYWGGYTHREIAALTETPLGTVKTRLHSALRDLGAALATPATTAPVA